MPTNNGNGGTLKYRVEQCELQIKCVNDKVDKILTNHLPHLQTDVQTMLEKLESVKTFVKFMTGINIVVVIIAFLLTKAIGG